MKNKFKLYILLAISFTLIFSACDKNSEDTPKDENTNLSSEKDIEIPKIEKAEKDKQEKQKEEKEEENEIPKPPGPKTKAGAEIGSLSTAWVEDREIYKKVSKKEYMSDSGYIVKAEDIHIPRFLIDSEDAKKTNEYLDEIEAKAIEAYENQILEEEFNWCNAGYYIFDDDEILSVLFYHNLIEDYAYEVYENYTFDLKTGKILDDREISKKFDIDIPDTMIEENIIRAAKDDTFFPDGPFTFRRFAAETLKNFWEDDKNLLYIDSAGKLSLNYNLATNYGLGFRFLTQEMDLPLQIGENEINPLFAMMSNTIGNPKIPEDKIAYIIYLGKADEEEGIKALLSNLDNLIFGYGYSEPPELLIRYSTESDNFTVEADEFYLIVPKFKNAIIYQESVDESGNIVSTDKEKTYTIEYALSMQNIYEKANANINIRYRDDIFSFTPSIVEGKVKVPKEVEDISFILEEAPIDEYRGYPELRDMILNMIPRG